MREWIAYCMAWCYDGTDRKRHAHEVPFELEHFEFGFHPLDVLVPQCGHTEVEVRFEVINWEPHGRPWTSMRDYDLRELNAPKDPEIHGSRRSEKLSIRPWTVRLDLMLWTSITGSLCHMISRRAPRDYLGNRVVCIHQKDDP